jgi:hypothetical protein
VKAEGGLATLVTKGSISMLGESPASFGHVGEPRARADRPEDGVRGYGRRAPDGLLAQEHSRGRKAAAHREGRRGADRSSAIPWFSSPPSGPRSHCSCSAAAFCIPLADGYFLADDFVQLANFAHWEPQGLLANEVLARFGASIDGVNGFWRPLTYTTFALNYLAGGADARAWLAVNLILHVANAALVAALVRRLHPAGGVRPAAFAAVFFFAFAPGWERCCGSRAATTR